TKPSSIIEPSTQFNTNEIPPVINTCVTDPSITTNPHVQTSSGKKSSVIKPSTTKSSLIAKPYLRTRSKCKLTDLSKEMLTNPDTLDRSSSTSSDHQLE
ncbi:18982_t:CDS:1, partial [Racocetra fulgida]